MYEAHQKAAWDHTSVVLALLHNTNCAAGKQKESVEFHPYREKPKRVMTDLDYRILKGLWKRACEAGK